MRKISIFRTVFVVLLLLLGVTGGVGASPPAQEPPGDVAALATVGTAFTYQGSLDDGGSPAGGAYDFEFELYDAVSGGSQVGSTITVADQTVTDGLFSVELDFGDVFDGTALWLQISVRPGPSTGSYTALSPRQSLTAAPYALYALDGWGGSWTGSGTGLTLSGGDTGLSASGTTYGVSGESAGTAGRGVFGYAYASSGSTYGVYGLNESTAGRGVFGKALADSGTTYGVYGESASTSGRGVFGYALADSGSAYGVYGASDSTAGRGVSGRANATSGTTYGVYGQNESNQGAGVSGTSTGVSGTGVRGEADLFGVYGTSDNFGVYGHTDSTSGVGVRGWSDATSGTNYGVKGRNKSPDGAGVFGENTSTDGTGVYGRADNTTGQGDGVYGETNSDDYFSRGVYGLASATTGNAVGVYGQTNSPDGYAGFFVGQVYISGGRSRNLSGGYGFLNPSGNTGTSSGSWTYSIYATDVIKAQEFHANSDARIKNIEGRSDGAADLATLSQIEITDYTLKDVIAKSGAPLKKVIGQQVETVYPQAVSRNTDVVPDIYQKATIKDGWVELATDLQPGERVRLIGEKNEGIYEVLEVTRDGFRTDFVADGAAVFVYGREVKDFRNVDYDAIAMLNVSATQELNHLVEQQAAEIEALTTRLTALEQAMNAGNAASNAPLSPWWLLGGLGVVGLVFVQQRRTGGKQ